MFANQINDPISRFTAQLIRTYLKFPTGKPITAFDPYARNGEALYEITRMHPESHRYGATPESHHAAYAKDKYVRICHSGYKAEHKITPDSFSLALVNPRIDARLADETFSELDPFLIPDFEKEERERLQRSQEMSSMIDFGEEGLTEEDKQKRQEDFEKKLSKAIDDREITFRRVIREQEKRTSGMRDEKLALAIATDKLMPGGVLVFITPKEFIDSHICFKLASSYEDIRIVRLQDDEYMDMRKCIIFARKSNVPSRDVEYAYQLMQTKYQPYTEMEVLNMQAETAYELPSKSPEDILNFRIGPITGEEAKDLIANSPVMNTYFNTYSQVFDNEIAQPPTALHKGHVALLLASGMLNGYIGTGPDQHLVKGSVTKGVVETEEEDDETDEVKIKEREYFQVGVKYLDRNGEFHKLM